MKFCTKTYPIFYFSDLGFTDSVWNKNAKSKLTNPIPYQVWLNWLGVEKEDDICVKPIYTKEINIKAEITSKEITEHQKRMLAMYNPYAQTLESGLDIALDVLTKQAHVIAQMKAEMKHINLDQFSGSSRKVLTLVNQL